MFDIPMDLKSLEKSIIAYEQQPGVWVCSIPYSFLEPYLSLQGMELLGLVDEPGA